MPQQKIASNELEFSANVFSITGAISVSAGSNTAPGFTTAGDTNTGMFFPAADTIAFTEGGVEALRLNANGQTATSTTGTASLPSFTRTGDENTGIFFPAADTIAFSEGGVESMRIDSSGNLGIGTNAPGTRLHVAGDILAASSTTIPVILCSSDQASGYAPPNIQMRRRAVNGAATPDNQIIGQIRFDGASVGNVYDNIGLIEVQGGVNASGGMPGSMLFYTASSGANAAERMRIDSAGNLIVGTTTALGRFTSAAATSQASIIAFSGNANGAYPSDTFGGHIGYNFSAGGGEVDFWNSWNGAGSTQGGFSFRKQTGVSSANTLFYIRGDGNVGIGTSSPTSGVRLDIVSADTSQQYVDVLKLKTSNTGDFHPSILFENNRNGVSNAFEIVMDSATTAGTSEMRIRTKDVGGTFNNRFRLTNTGDVQLMTAGTKMLNSSGNAILNQTGSVLQVVQSGSNGTSTASTSYVDSGLTASITPTSSTSKILVTVNGVCRATNVRGGFALVRGSTQLFGYQEANGTGNQVPYSFTFLDSPATTSSTTYKLQIAVAAGSGTFGINDAGAISSGNLNYITLMEIAG